MFDLFHKPKDYSVRYDHNCPLHPASLSPWVIGQLGSYAASAIGNSSPIIEHQDTSSSYAYHQAMVPRIKHDLMAETTSFVSFDLCKHVEVGFRDVRQNDMSLAKN